MATWRSLITYAMSKNGDSFDSVVSNTMTDGEMDVVFNSGYGCPEGIPFTLWTERYVYFPVVYDGREWVGCVARNPDGKATGHQGG